MISKNPVIRQSEQHGPTFFIKEACDVISPLPKEHGFGIAKGKRKH